MEYQNVSTSNCCTQYGDPAQARTEIIGNVLLATMADGIPPIMQRGMKELNLISCNLGIGNEAPTGLLRTLWNQIPESTHW